MEQIQGFVYLYVWWCWQDSFMDGAAHMYQETYNVQLWHYNMDGHYPRIS